MFSRSGFLAQLAGLSQTQLSIQTCSRWVLRLQSEEDIGKMVKVWYDEFRQHDHRQLVMLYLCNDIIQVSRGKYGDDNRFIKGFLKVLKHALYRFSKSNPKLTPKVQRILTVLKNRNVLGGQAIDELKQALEGNAPAVRELVDANRDSYETIVNEPNATEASGNDDEEIDEKEKIRIKLEEWDAERKNLDEIYDAVVKTSDKEASLDGDLDKLLDALEESEFSSVHESITAQNVKNMEENLREIMENQSKQPQVDEESKPRKEEEKEGTEEEANDDEEDDKLYKTVTKEDVIKVEFGPALKLVRARMEQLRAASKRNENLMELLATNLDALSGSKEELAKLAERANLVGAVLVDYIENVRKAEETLKRKRAHEEKRAEEAKQEMWNQRQEEEAKKKLKPSDSNSSSVASSFLSSILAKRNASALSSSNSSYVSHQQHGIQSYYERNSPYPQPPPSSMPAPSYSSSYGSNRNSSSGYSSYGQYRPSQGGQAQPPPSYGTNANYRDYRNRGMGSSAPPPQQLPYPPPYANPSPPAHPPPYHPPPYQAPPVKKEHGETRNWKSYYQK